MEGDFNYEEVLMFKTVWYYYIENYTQQKISELLGISRVRVIRLLDKARQTGIVSFCIKKENNRHMRAEKALISQYGLKDAFVLPIGSNQVSDVNESLAQAAAMYIRDRLGTNTFINMGYGDTPSRALNYLARSIDTPVDVVSLTGGVTYYLPNIQSSVFNARLHLIPSPLIMGSPEMAEWMRREESVQRIQKLINIAKLTVVGIGGMTDNATILQNGILSKSDFLVLAMQGAVGDILSHFIDKDGNPVENDLEDRLVSTSLEDLRKMDNVIGVAGGRHKVAAIRAVLTGGYLDVLITDEDTAYALVGDQPSTREDER